MCEYSRNVVNISWALFLKDKSCPLTHLSPVSLLWDIGKQNSPRCDAAERKQNNPRCDAAERKQNSPRCDAAERGVLSGAILFAERIFIEKLNKI